MTEVLRQSSRAKKLSVAMRTVDAETRRIVMKNRLDALEGDRLFDEYIPEQEDVGEAQDWAENQGEIKSDEDDHDIDSSGDSIKEEIEEDPDKFWAQKQKKTKTIIKDKRKTRAQEKQIEKVPKIKAKKIQKKNEQDVKKRPRLDLQKFFDPETHEGYLNFACLPSKRP